MHKILSAPELKTLSQKVGGLSKPSKMPCESFSIPAEECTVGSKLRKDKKSTCADCYALKGNYRFSNVKKAQKKRLENLLLDLEQWRHDMTAIIYNTNSSGFFRWHDAGDLQSIEHLRAINNIAKDLPQIKFWLPTREYKIVKQFTDAEEIADNLTIRLSAYFKSSAPPLATAEALGVQTSTVDYSDSHQCTAPNFGGRCMTCRACWDKSITNINYQLH